MLDYLLLGMLVEPATGYELKRVFSQTLRHFWDAKLSQIYPALQRMEEQGWLKSRMEPSTRGPARRVYRRTARGKAALLKWLASAPEIPQPRIPFLGQLVFAHEAGDRARPRALLEQLRAAFEARRSTLLEVEAQWFVVHPGWPDDLPDDVLHAHFAVRAGLYRLDAAIRWCDESLARLEARTRRGVSQE